MDCKLINSNHEERNLLLPDTNWISGVANCSTLDHFFPRQSDKLIVAGGYNFQQGEFRSTEMFDLSNPTLKCQHDLDLPIPLAGGAAGVISQDSGVQVPIVCGGYVYFMDGIYERGCYQLGTQIPFAQLSLAKYSAGTVLLDKGKTLWVTGGSQYPNML